jgi:hypothetical protein
MWWEGRRVARWCGIVAGLLCAVVWAGSPSPRRFEVGQQWRYRHEGPRPGSIEPNAIDGERILWVLSTAEEQGKTRWAIEECFTNDEGVIGRLYVDQDGLLTAIEIENRKGETARLHYDPPVPYQPADMNVAEVKTIQTTLRIDSASFALPSKTVTERLADETVATPMGEFPGCSHFQSTTTSTVDIKIARIPVTEERERWYHPSVNGMVKEVYRKGPIKFLGWSRPGYTATSILTAYGKETPPLTGRTRAQTPVEGDSPKERDHSPSGGLGRRWRNPIVLAGVAVLVTVALIRARRTGRKRVSS